MFRATAAAFAAFSFVVMSANLPAFGQEKPFPDFELVDPGDYELVQPGDYERVDPVPVERPHAPPVDPNAPAKLCFWKSPSVSGFGKSGFCEASNQMAVGATCRCYTIGGRPEFVGDGMVILAPNSNQSSDVVR